MIAARLRFLAPLRRLLHRTAEPTAQPDLVHCLIGIRDHLIADHSRRYPGMDAQLRRWLAPVDPVPVARMWCWDCHTHEVDCYFVGDVHSVTRYRLVCERCIRARAAHIANSLTEGSLR